MDLHMIGVVPKPAQQARNVFSYYFRRIEECAMLFSTATYAGIFRGIHYVGSRQ